MVLAVIEQARLFGVAVSLVDHAPLGFVETQFRLRAHDIRPGAAMGETRVHRVHAVLDALKPIAVLNALHRNINLALTNKKIIARHQRCRLRSEVGEDQTAQLLDRIRRQADRLLLQFTVGRLAGNLPALAVAIIEPSVIAAPHTVLLDIAET